MSDANGAVTNDKPAEEGFELNGIFYRWNVTDGGKDLMLIDRFTEMPVHEFFAIIEDSFDRGRAPILLALIATSVSHRHPEWGVNRVERLVLGLNLGDVKFIDADVEEDPRPLASADATESTGTKSSDASSSSPTPESTSPSETFSGTPV